MAEGNWNDLTQTELEVDSPWRPIAPVAIAECSTESVSCGAWAGAYAIDRMDLQMLYRAKRLRTSRTTSTQIRFQDGPAPVAIAEATLAIEKLDWGIERVDELDDYAEECRSWIATIRDLIKPRNPMPHTTPYGAAG